MMRMMMMMMMLPLVLWMGVDAAVVWQWLKPRRHAWYRVHQSPGRRWHGAAIEI